jgi:hypothetical protein
LSPQLTIFSRLGTQGNIGGNVDIQMFLQDLLLRFKVHFSEKECTTWILDLNFRFISRGLSPIRPFLTAWSRFRT